MSDSGTEQTPVLPADAEEALIESTEVDNPTEDADTAQMQADENLNNGIDPEDDPAKEPEDDDEDMDDLFGDGGDDEAPSKKRRLDDEELDSGDDLGRDDRMAEDEEPASPPQQKDLIMAEMELSRHARLKGSDGEVYLLRNATYNGIEPKVFNPETFTPPVTNHHSTEAPIGNFSAAQTAATTIRWRRDPNDPAKMQSNSRVIRWSDGSLTLQIGSNPLEQYELTAKPATRPQLRPKKPLPAALQRKKAIAKNEEGNIYLTSVDESSNIGRLTNHITAFLDVRSNKLAAPDDDAVQRLQMSLNASNAAKHGGPSAAGAMQVITQLEDPEMLRKRAEAAEKDKAKAERARTTKQERENARRYGAGAGRERLGRGGGIGLSISALEEEGYGASRKRAPPKKRARKNDYSDDEDLGRGRTREDEYDEEDDFIAPSDEEEPEGGDDDEEELLDEDAEGEEDDAPVQQSVERNDEPSGQRRGRRQVLDDDEDE